MNRLVVGKRIYNLDHVRKVYIGENSITMYYISGHEDKIDKLSAVSVDPEVKSMADVDEAIHYVWSNKNTQEFFAYKKEDIDKEWDRIIKELKGTP